MKSILKLYGPNIPIAMKELKNIDLTELPIEKGERVFGKFDYVFYWTEIPTTKPLLELIKRIDDAMVRLPTKYSITSESHYISKISLELEKRNMTESIYTLIKVYGPRLLEAVKGIEKAIDRMQPTTKTFEALKSSILIGEWDYAFEWEHYPTPEELDIILHQIDKEVLPTGALYFTRTVRKVMKSEKLIYDPSSDNSMAFLL